MTNKGITLVVIIILIILGIWWYMASRTAPEAMNYDSSSQAAQVDTSTTSVTSTTTASSTDSSDAALDQDMTNVDGQMNGLSSDNASADNSLNNPNQ